MALASQPGASGRPSSDAPGDTKYICCNADEGDSGTFADRMLMEGDPFTLLEGMTIAALAVGATQGYIYLRSEYPDAGDILNAAIAEARDFGWLGSDVLGSGRAFDISVRMGAGAYICGEETSMLDSLEGKRGMVRAKPPLPALEGLFGKPTVVNNVLTLGSVPFVLAEGADAYASRGLDRSLGTQVFQLAGNIKQGGVVELGFGVTLRELVEGFGGGTASGRPLRADPGRWTARLLPDAGPARPAAGVRDLRRGRCDGRPRRRSSCMTTPSTWRAWPASPWSSAPRSRAASARRAASVRRAASR